MPAATVNRMILLVVKVFATSEGLRVADVSDSGDSDVRDDGEVEDIHECI